MSIHTSGAGPPSSRFDGLSLAAPMANSRSPFRGGNIDRRRSSSRRTGTSTSSASRPLLTSRPVMLWTHEPPNFSTHELVLNPDLIAAFGGVSDGSELLEVRLPESSSKGNPVGGVPEDDPSGGEHGSRLSGRPDSTAKARRRRDKGIARRGFLFKASQAVGDLDCIERSGSQLQLSVSKNIASIFHLHNRCEVILSKVPRFEHIISHIELYFRDQYVGRADMWRLVSLLEDTCVYVGQRVTLAGCVRATVGRIFINEKKVMSGYVGPQSRAIFRSESAKYNLFIQMASEMWDFDEDGELYYEKALSGYLPDLIRRWRAGSTTHVVSIILFARVHYEDAELHMLQDAGLPLRREEGGKRRWYIDYYKVMVDLESDCDWSTALTMLKEEFFRFRHDVLLLRRPISGPAGAPWLEEQHADLLRRDRALLAGTLSASHEGNILEAINLALNPFDEHYIDRDLNRTGLDLVVVSAGTGHFDVDKKMLRLTTERLIDNGIGLDLVCLTKMPLHSVPLFHFQSQVPAPNVASQSAAGSWSAKRRARSSTAASNATQRANPAGNMQSAMPDPLYFDPKHASQPHTGPSPTTGATRPSGLADFYSIPHWVDCSFYNMQQDKPFRADRFVPRCKMHEVQMLGLMENEISDIALPYIDFGRIPGVVASGQSQGKFGSQSSNVPTYSSSGSKLSRHYMLATESFGDLSGLGTREQRRLLREQFDKETFRDLEDVPTAFRPFVVQGASEKSVAQLLSSSPPQVRNATQSGNASIRQATQNSAPDGLQSTSPAAQTVKSVSRKARGGRDSMLTLPALESHEEQPDAKEGPSPTKDSWDRQDEPASPRQKRISILPSLGNSTAQPSTGSNNLYQTLSRAASISSLNTIGRGLRPFSEVGKAKASVASTDVTFDAASKNNEDEDKAETHTTMGIEKGSSRATEEATRSRGKAGYSWLWSTLRGKSTGSKEEEDVHGDNHGNEVTPRQASLKIQALLKGQTSRAASLSRPASIKSISHEKLHEEDTGDAGPSPILIPQHGPGESSKADANKVDMVVTNADGQPLLSEHEAFEQALEEEEAKLRYAQQAHVEKQTLVNPCNPRKSLQAKAASNSQIMRWQHAFPRRLNQHVVKWRSMTTPACLPLTTYYLPSESDLKSHWQEYPYQMSVSSDMTSFLVKRAPSTPPALAVLREMASQRLAQGYQFIVPIKSSGRASHTSASAMPDGLRLREPWELFQPGSLASGNPIFLSMTNQIHRIFYDRSSNCIHVKRFVRRVEYDTSPMTYACCVWARNLPGYQTINAEFRYPDFGAYNWTHLDAVIAGHNDDESFTESTRYWRTRFVVVPSEGSPQVLRGPSGERLSDEEVRLAGMDRLADLFNRSRWRPKPVNPGKRGAQRSTPQQAPSAPLRFIPTSLDPAMSLKDEDFMRQVEAAHDEESKETETRRQRQRTAARASRLLSETDKASLVKEMHAVDGHGLNINDRLWNKILYRETFSGSDFVTWLCQEFADVHTREEATEWGQHFLNQSLIQHVHDYHGFLDGHYFYRLSPQYAVSRTNQDRSWFSAPSRGGANADRTENNAYERRDNSATDGTVHPSTSQRKGSRRVLMSRSMIIDVDPGKRSDRSEVAFLHYDLAHNPANGFNFQIHWLGSTARFIEDLVQGWTRAVERYGLRLIEAPINQIKDVSLHNPFQAPLPISLALHPPPAHVYSRWLPDQTAAIQLFEYALLRKFGFILDQEASDKYRNTSKEIVIEYKSRPNHFDYSQFVHRSGVAFVQVVPAGGGFLWLDNRLYNSHLHANERQQQQQQQQHHHPHNHHQQHQAQQASANMISSSSPKLAGGSWMGPPWSSGSGPTGSDTSSLPSADRVRREFIDFCSDADRLEIFYRDVLEQLQTDAAVAAEGTMKGNEPGKGGSRTSSVSSSPKLSDWTRDSKRA